VSLASFRGRVVVNPVDPPMLTETKITPKLQHNTLMDDIMDYLPNKSAQSKTATKPLSLNEILKQNSLIQQNKP
jgi:hypothetical protein